MQNTTHKVKVKVNPSDEKTKMQSTQNVSFINVLELEENGFYFQANKDKELDLSQSEYISKYCYNNIGDLNENNLFVSPGSIIDFELDRLQNIMNLNEKIEICEFKLLVSMIGNDLLSDIMRIIDRKYVKQIRSKQFNKIFYSVSNEKAIHKKERIQWRKVKKKMKKQKEKNDKMQQEMTDMSFKNAQIFALKQKQEEREQQQRKTKINRKNTNNKKWKYKYIKSCKKLKEKRIKNNTNKRVLSLPAVSLSLHPSYKMLKCIKNKTRLHYTVFLGTDGIHFCQCTKYKNILRRLYSIKHLRPKDIFIKQPILPFCKHILAVKIALILKEFEVINVSEEIWSQGVIGHISNNVR